jgi:UPF0755 protein
LVALLLSIPDHIEEVFGAPAPGLSTMARFRLGTWLLLQEKDLTLPVNPAGAELPFTIASGESVPSITQRLAREGLIMNPGAFRAYLQYSGLDTRLQAGDYRLSPAMSPMEIAQKMQDATPDEVVFSILAGWRIEEIAASLPTSGLSISPEAFISTTRLGMPALPVTADFPELASLEGLLFPGEYIVPRQVNAPDLIQLILARFENELTDELRQAYAGQSISLYEALILASIVERESVMDDEMPIIASVFYNRISAGMKLESDPTVQYAIGYNATQGTWWTNPLSLADLQTESLYNTYIYPGLPPTPIANPGILALRAVAFPAQTPYYYFRAACDRSGRHLFAETYAEHLQNACP